MTAMPRESMTLAKSSGDLVTRSADSARLLQERSSGIAFTECRTWDRFRATHPLVLLVLTALGKRLVIHRITVAIRIHALLSGVQALLQILAHSTVTVTASPITLTPAAKSSGLQRPRFRYCIITPSSGRLAARTLTPVACKTWARLAAHTSTPLLLTTLVKWLVIRSSLALLVRWEADMHIFGFRQPRMERRARCKTLACLEGM